MKFILIFIAILDNGGIHASKVATLETMDKCFESRDILVKSIGRPIKNYQAVCVLSDTGKKT